MRLIRLAQRVAVNQAEFADASSSMDIIITVVYERAAEIERAKKCTSVNGAPC
jgi:hypothetical protein